MTLERAAFSLHELVDELLPVFSARAADKGLQLYSQFCPQLPALVLGDSMRLRQVLSNLVGNAVKFTGAGHVLLRAQAVAAQGGTGAAGTRVRFEVCDTGPGIPADKRDLVFQAFAQADTSTARHHGGTGPGLTISADLLKLMGSELQLDSTPGQGCTFHFEIDFARAQPAPGQRVAALRDWPLQRVLWIDPQPMTRHWYAAVLRQWRIDVDEADGIEQGLARLSSPAARYDIVFACGSLLVGEQAAGWDRVIECAGGVRLVVLSSPRHSLPADARPFAAQARLLMAPVSLLKLNALFGATVSGPLTALAAAPAANARRNVLLVEDNDVNALIAVEVLQRAGGCVVRAVSGEDALAAFSARAFDLVLMDLQMPGMDGYEATRRIRAWERAQDRRVAVPIVALTANALAGDAAACLACGMNDYLTKPVRPEQLLRLLRAPPGLVAAEPASAQAAEPDAAEPLQPVFEPAVLAALPMVADGSQPGYGKRVLALYLGGKERALDAIERALEQGDQRTLLRHVHTLKSSSARSVRWPWRRWPRRRRPGCAQGCRPTPAWRSACARRSGNWSRCWASSACSSRRKDSRHDSRPRGCPPAGRRRRPDHARHGRADPASRRLRGAGSRKRRGGAGHPRARSRRSVAARRHVARHRRPRAVPAPARAAVWRALADPDVDRAERHRIDRRGLPQRRHRLHLQTDQLDPARSPRALRAARLRRRRGRVAQSRAAGARPATGQHGQLGAGRRRQHDRQLGRAGVHLRRCCVGG